MWPSSTSGCHLRSQTKGPRAAARLRDRWPALGILLLSQSLESRYAARLAQDHPEGFGYLLKDRVVDVDRLVEALTQLARGGTVLDPDVVAFCSGAAPHENASMDSAPASRTSWR
jgi:DNA-binding NarL/FixJ family response regulator